MLWKEDLPYKRHVACGSGKIVPGRKLSSLLLQAFQFCFQKRTQVFGIAIWSLVVILYSALLSHLKVSIWQHHLSFLSEIANLHFQNVLFL